MSRILLGYPKNLVLEIFWTAKFDTLTQVPLGGRSLSPIALKIKFGLHTAHRHLMLAPQLSHDRHDRHDRQNAVRQLELFLEMPPSVHHRCIAQRIRDIRTSLSWAPSEQEYNEQEGLRARAMLQSHSMLIFSWLLCKNRHAQHTSIGTIVRHISQLFAHCSHDQHNDLIDFA